VPLLALVQASLAELPELRRFKPIEHEQGALDAAQFLQRKIELVLPLKGREPLQHRGRQHGSACNEATKRRISS
jgi:hypothetical protein